MIVTDHFVFIHMHKTGGQTLNDIIKRCLADSREIGYHFPRSETPAEFENSPVVGFVRNPWDWYVSWYAFNRRPTVNNQLFNVISNSGLSEFKTTVTNLINLGSDSDASKMYRDDLVSMLPESLEGNRAAGLTKESIRGFSSNETGYYSWLFERMLGDDQDGRTHIGRFENYENDFLSIMQHLGVRETEKIRKAFESSGRVNVSRHTHYSHYYDDELRDLVAQKERGLIEKFGYEFESIKPPGVVYSFPADLYAGGNGRFHKLLNRQNNFLKLHHNFDVGPLRRRIEQIPDSAWLESEREKLFAVHKHTQSIMLVHFEDFKHERPEYSDLYYEMQDELKPLVDYVAAYYRNNGFIVRLLLAKLLGGGKIPHHTDSGYSLLNCHRVHVPVVTNEGVLFTVGGEQINMRVGEFWEINNGADHAVTNSSDEDRVHIIIDWMPNHAGEPLEDVLVPDDAKGTAGQGVPVETIDAMIARAYQVHQSGQAARAESLYRQILHADDDNVIANNLFGLLCMQLKRFDEAVYHIEKALSVSPNDAQAHSNLGIALKDLGRNEEAEKHFHESLKIDPNNPKVYNNLGAIYMMLNRIDDAIHCYRYALKIQPAFAEALFNLGSALIAKRQFAEAADVLQKCLTLRPDIAACRSKLEQALRGMRDQDRAAQGQ